MTRSFVLHCARNSSANFHRHGNSVGIWGESSLHPESRSASSSKGFQAYLKVLFHYLVTSAVRPKMQSHNSWRKKSPTGELGEAPAPQTEEKRQCLHWICGELGFCWELRYVWEERNKNRHWHWCGNHSKPFPRGNLHITWWIRAKPHDPGKVNDPDRTLLVEFRAKKQLLQRGRRKCQLLMIKNAFSDGRMDTLGSQKEGEGLLWKGKGLGKVQQKPRQIL